MPEPPAEGSARLVMPWDRGNWRLLFLLAPAPGAPLRFLERRRLAGDTLPSPFFLSEPAPPHGFRALFSPAADRAMLAEIGERLSLALPRTITLLWQETDAPGVSRWGFHTWEGGQAKDESQEIIPPPTPLQRLTARLPGARTPSVPVAWAARRGFPIARLPLLARPAPPIIEYLTVAKLDRKSMLVENAPILYRFEP